MCCIFCICCLYFFVLRIFFLHLLFACFLWLLPCLNLALHFFCIILGCGGRGPAKCEKKPHPAKKCKTNANAAGNGQVFQILYGFGSEGKLCISACCFAAASGLSLFFAFWTFSGFRCGFFSHFAGPRPPQPKMMQKKCNAKFKQGSNHKKLQTANAKKNAQHKKCKQQMQKACKTNFQALTQSVAQRFSTT